MTLVELWEQTLAQAHESPLVTGAVSVITILTLMLCIFAILLGCTFLLRHFFKRHPAIDYVHRSLLYILTMVGVLVLLIGGLLGLVLPIIPGILLIIIALVLLRKYHRSEWVDRNLRKLTLKMRLKRSWRKFLGHVRRHRRKHLLTKGMILKGQEGKRLK